LLHAILYLRKFLKSIPGYYTLLNDWNYFVLLNLQRIHNSRTSCNILGKQIDNYIIRVGVRPFWFYFGLFNDLSVPLRIGSIHKKQTFAGTVVPITWVGQCKRIWIGENIVGGVKSTPILVKQTSHFGTESESGEI